MADGQWGKPPVDEIGKPLYGDVFGESQDSVKDMPEEVRLSLLLYVSLLRPTIIICSLHLCG